MCYKQFYIFEIYKESLGVILLENNNVIHIW